MGCSKGNPKRKVHIIQTYLKKQERSQVHNLTLHFLKELEKEQKKKPKSSRRRDIINIRKEINDIETTTTTKTSEQANETKSRFFAKNKQH